MQQQGGMLEHVAARRTGAIDRPTHTRIQAEHQADLEVIPLVAVTALDKQPVDVVLFESAILQRGSGGVDGKFIASLVRTAPCGLSPTPTIQL